MDLHECGHHVHPTAGTIFEKSSTSLQLWYYAMYLVTSTRCGISAKQLERQIGVSYKTAWRMLNKIRNQLMTQDDEPLSGEVEVDETYFGGKPRASDTYRARQRAKAEGHPWKARAIRVGRRRPCSQPSSAAAGSGRRSWPRVLPRRSAEPSSGTCCPSRLCSPTSGRPT